MQRDAVPSSEKERRSRKIVVILLVDDGDIGELLVQAISQERHHYVHVAHSCSQALHFVQHIKPDVCLVEYHLPDGSGLDLSHQLHACYGLEAVPLVVMMTDRGIFLSPMEQQYGVASEKPLDLDTLLQVIEQQLHAPMLAIP